MAREQKNITKADMIAEIANRTGLSRTHVRIIIEEWMQLVKESVRQGFTVQLRGFGSFFKKRRASKKARNIQQGTTIDIPAHEVPAYKPSRDFINMVKNN